MTNEIIKDLILLFLPLSISIIGILIIFHRSCNQKIIPDGSEYEI